MKYFIDKLIYSMLLISSVMVVSCTDNFEEINTNPNEPVTVPTAHLLTSAERSLIGEFFGNHDNLSGIGTTVSTYSQYIAGLRGGFDDIYLTVEADFSDIYTGGLRNLEEIISLNTDEETSVIVSISGANVNQIAVAKILKAWAFHNMTDIWGDIPYFEALKGKGNALPVYDTQESIYLDLLEELTEASDMIDLSATSPTGEVDIVGDIIYKGDMELWKKFANSLKMRVALRLSKVLPSVSEVAISEAYAEGVFESNFDNAMYSYLAAAPNYNPYYFRYELSVPNYGITNTMVDKLADFSDPRLIVYADTAERNDLGGGYVGMPFGLSRGTASGISDFAVSWPNKKNILQITTPYMMMSFAEVQFILAEAAEKGWIAGDPAAFYEGGIEASMTQWGIETSEIDTYLAQPEIQYNTADPYRSIGDQKWIALYMQGIQGWAEWRRLGFPELEVAQDALIDGIPRRKGYPPSETNLNKANYDKAIERQGPDILLTRVWWDAE